MPAGSMIAKAWLQYRELCIHKDAGPVQVEECRKCFYAGVMTMLTINDALSEPNVTEVQAILTLESVWLEMRAYAQSLSDNGPGGLTDQELKVKEQPKES